MEWSSGGVAQWLSGAIEVLHKQEIITGLVLPCCEMLKPTSELNSKTLNILGWLKMQNKDDTSIDNCYSFDIESNN